MRVKEMTIIDLILISFGVAMDAFAVSIGKGLTMKKLDCKNILLVGLYFGGFQALMPTIGYFLGKNFEVFITSIDHFIAFILLLIIGINMIKESIKGEDENINDKFDFKTMIPLAIATSIDALAIGVTFSFLKVDLFLSVMVIGIITAIISMIGVIIGKQFGNKLEKSSQIIGGLILIFIGLKILLEHLNII
jgi:putative Mn2+ efflux pump MntP